MRKMRDISLWTAFAVVIAAFVITATPPSSAPAAPATPAPAPPAVELPTSDSLEYVIRNDYLICTGDTTFISLERLFAWKHRIDSLVLTDRNYREKFNTFVRATGLKAHEVRPCEPLAFSERLERQLREMDSLVNAVRARREREYRDSTTLATELVALKTTPVDIFGIPAGMSKNAVRLALARNHNIRVRNVQNNLQIDNVKMFDTLTVAVALHFGADGKYTGYEIETAAIRAERLDSDVRAWAAIFLSYYTEKLGAPNARSLVGFHDIKQGRLSIIGRWDKDAAKNRPRTAVGLATHNNLYYAKVIVNY